MPDIFDTSDVTQVVSWVQGPVKETRTRLRSNRGIEIRRNAGQDVYLDISGLEISVEWIQHDASRST